MKSDLVEDPVLYWDEIAEEIERRAMTELGRQYRPGQSQQSVAWKKAIIDVMAEKSKLLRRLGAAQKRK